MKKRFVAVLICLMFLVCPVLFMGCGGNEVHGIVRYFYNYGYINPILEPIEFKDKVYEVEWTVIGKQIEQSIYQPLPPSGYFYHVFAGWYKDEGCTSLWDFNSDIVLVETLHLFAKWRLT